mgnify:CR=1 FL=1
MSLLYRAIDGNTTSVLVTAWEKGEMIGFAAGGGSMRRIYLRLLKRPLALAKALAPVLLSPRQLVRVVDVVRYTFGGSPVDAEVPPPPNELLSIAVTPAARGQGHADSLYQRLCDEFSARGVDCFRIVVGSDLARAHRFYARMGARPIGKLKMHRGAASVVYLHEISPAVGAAEDESLKPGT